MIRRKHKTARITDSMLTIGIGLASLYWVLESFLYFFFSPEINIVQHLIGSQQFGALNRIMVLCLFILFGSHVQYTLGLRRRTQAVIGERERKYESIIENIEEGYFETDTRGNLTFVNSSVCRTADMPREALLGMNFTAFFTKENVVKLAKRFEDARHKNNAVEIPDIEVSLPQGKKLVMELSTSPLLDADGRVKGFRSVARDVTERLHMQQKKKRLAAQLEQVQKMEAIGTLAGGIAGDFDQVLNGMQATLGELLDKVDPDDPFYRKLVHIDQYAHNGYGLIQQLQRLSSGGDSSQERLVVNDLIEKAARMFGRSKTTIAFHFDYEQALWPVNGDAGQLEQVLMNLFVNARHAMPEGGEIFIRTRNLYIGESDIKPCKLASGRYVQIAITDTGKGIPKDIQPRIFEPFFTTRDAGEGTGLGLATVYGILEGHEGGITVYSEPDHGTTFNIYLPARA
jgi:two-component system cell cycle sensor histidine kinase/response regulator CckA